MSTLYRNLPDEDLVHRIALKQDRDAFTTLFQRYKHLAAGVCLKYLGSEPLARDAVQTVFLKIWTDAHLYQIRKFRSWFYQVLKNHCLMELRKSNPGQAIQPEGTTEHMEWEDNLHLKLKEETLLVQLDRCIRSLKESQRLCITYFYIEEKSYQETALLTGFSNKEVKSHIQNGRRNLKICLHQKMNQMP